MDLRRDGEEFRRTAAAIERIEEQDPEVPAGLRDRLLDVVADVEIDFSRRHAAIVRRVESLERRAMVLALSEEMKGFLVMLGFSVGAAIIVPIVTGLIEKWRRSSS